MKKEAFQKTRFARLMSHEAFEVFEQKLKKSQGVRYPLHAGQFFAKSHGDVLLCKMILWWLRNAGHLCYWIPGVKSAAGDLYAVINGTTCFYRVDAHQDRRNSSHEQYKKAIQEAGGQYINLHSFDSFLAHYKSLT